MQERLLKKLGPNSFPFFFELPQNSPASITIQPAAQDQGEPCGVQYYVKLFVGEHEGDRSHRRFLNLTTIYEQYWGKKNNDTLSLLLSLCTVSTKKEKQRPFSRKIV